MAIEKTLMLLDSCFLDNVLDANHVTVRINSAHLCLTAASCQIHIQYEDLIAIFALITQQVGWTDEELDGLIEAVGADFIRQHLQKEQNK